MLTDFDKKMAWANLLLGLMTVGLLLTIVIQIYVATGIADVRTSIAKLQEQMKAVQGAIIVQEKKDGGK